MQCECKVSGNKEAKQMPSVKVPKIVVEEIDNDEFRKACLKFAPKEPPAFQFKDIVSVTRDFGRLAPGVVIGCESRIDGHSYQVVTPRFDGVLEVGQYPADKLVLVESAG